MSVTSVSVRSNALLASLPNAGTDSDGRVYGSAGVAWEKVRELARVDNRTNTSENKTERKDCTMGGWYDGSAEYWEKQSATLDGVLGGITSINDVDIRGSKAFLSNVPDFHPKSGAALDCGAGIGRVTKHLLSELFARVDINERAPQMLTQARAELSACANIGEYFGLALQEFSPKAKTYRCIWIQWVVEHLTDEDLVQFLRRCKTALDGQGIIVVKENHTRPGQGFYLDLNDCSMVRSREHFEELFSDAGLETLRCSEQTDLVPGMYPVRMWALR
eukprot:128400_1